MKTGHYHDLGIVQLSEEVSEIQLYEVYWVSSGQYSATFTEHSFYNTGDPRYKTRWDLELDGSVSEQEKLAFRIKHGI